jgi:hypothetical protein
MIPRRLEALEALEELEDSGRIGGTGRPWGWKNELEEPADGGRTEPELLRQKTANER